MKTSPIDSLKYCASSRYLVHLNDIMENGEDHLARGLSFRENLGVAYTIPMANPVPLIPARNLGFRFAVAEPWWILSGMNTLREIAPFGKMAPYSDNGYYMSGAYGPKIVDQLHYVCQTLADDIGSRQAVINIWRERPGPSKDIPCTLSLQFLVRNGRINCVATMRSSDAYMGLPYDSILFSMTSAFVLSLLEHHYVPHDFELGDLTVFLGSAHIYDRDFTKVSEIIHEWDFKTDIDIDLNQLAKYPPRQFLDILENAAIDEDGAGILELSGLRAP